MQRVPRLAVGIVARFPPATRVSDVEDLLVLDNLSGGRVEFALAPDAEPEAIVGVCTALRGEALTRLDPVGTPRSFTLTPRPARRTITTWRPLSGAAWPTNARRAWRLEPETDGGPQALLVSVESLMQSSAVTRSPSSPPSLRVIDAGPRPSVEDLERLVRRVEDRP